MDGLQTVVTMEDHLVDGGFGSWLLESLPNGSELRSRIEIRGLNPAVCGMVGSQQALNKLGGPWPAGLSRLLIAKKMRIAL